MILYRIVIFLVAICNTIIYVVSHIPTMKCNTYMLFIDVKFHWIPAQNGYKQRAFNLSIFSKLQIITHVFFNVYCEL